MGQVAQKISKVDHDKLIGMLHTAFAEEWLAYYQYWVGAQVAVGPMRDTIIKEFMKHADEELKHAKMISDRLIQLGDNPILDPADWAKKAQCKYEIPSEPFVFKLAEQNLIGERCAIMRYEQICEFCWGKDFDTFKMSEKIMHEELDHEQDMEDYLADWEMARKYSHQ